MNISYNWLKRYLDTDLPAEEIARILTDIGLEVEGFEKIETVKGGLHGVVVGEVLTCTDHPDSDHLHLTTVDVGAGDPLQIVCGAPNCRAGLKVLCATVGTVLYPGGGDEEFKIKRSKIRGVESLGMLCAEDELGIGASHDGIMELPADARVGMTAKEYLGIEDDYLIEVGLTPNRVDAASHIGVARDLAAYLRSQGLNAEVKMPDVSAFAPDNHDLPVTVRVENHEAAPRYAGVTVKNCKIGPSPEWMQNCLRAAGINPKNNLVDITNFVLFELGQPLHAFDAAKIEGREVVVRTCAEGTPFVTLDGVERKLTADDLMICSAERPMCIAGVFGGLDSGIGDTTTDVFIESAYFNPVWVRKTAKRFGLNTDSSFRFERGVDPNMQVYAAKRAALLMKELAGGEISSDITDIYPDPVEDFKFDISFARIDSLIGKKIPEDTVRTILAALEVKILAEKEGVLSVAVPPYRVDVQREADLVEDILRIYGYNNVEIPSRVRSTLSYAPKPDRSKLMNLAADFLTSNGFTEIMSNSLTKAAYYEGLESYKPENCVRILNPLSADLNVMRQTLLFNMLEAVQLNANRKNGDLKLYEFGNCYFYDESKRSEENRLAAYSEEYRLAIAVTGVAEPASWNARPQAASFFTLRAVAEKLLRRFGIDIYALRTETLQNDLFGEALSMSLGGKELLQIGTVSAKIRRRLDVKQDVYYLEMNFDALVKSTRKHKIAAEELSKFPEVKRDLALLIDKQVTFSALRDVAFATERKLLKSVSLFDVYEGDKLPEGKKSYALSFILEDKTRTLDEKTIEKAMKNLTAQFEQRCGAQVRG
ncbi:phenylalanine--tRNA ligase subunit beta [Alistipes finegoldii]|uniref:phenylalanine--tRNA ligase subunit beta n=1 Tax=Alistipes finegoldii TaxID=214856 RepID=UPI001C377590|nr:phenylalanine--tRNA ligase subunit beta [Alistipes finegoldii]MBV4326072.1 phenylalanine--tRNA ligase subunit beta [Alistipes finegoldii]MBV4350519.1 phenylalanine--tRNA ligase subunit beta [Alistipes finegoldii]MBV4371256.1 phenylalanine--tRNA ligase subunit beta [Alistipes finegoldii]